MNSNTSTRADSPTTGVIVLSRGVTETRFEHEAITPASVVSLMPQSSAATAEGLPYVVERLDGEVTFHHSDHPNGDRRYFYAVL